MLTKNDNIIIASSSVWRMSFYLYIVMKPPTQFPFESQTTSPKLILMALQDRIHQPRVTCFVNKMDLIIHPSNNKCSIHRKFFKNRSTSSLPYFPHPIKDYTKSNTYTKLSLKKFAVHLSTYTMWSTEWELKDFWSSPEKWFQTWLAIRAWRKRWTKAFKGLQQRH